MQNYGVISQVIGPVIDVTFEENLPIIYERLDAELDGRDIAMEVLSLIHI